LIGTRRQHNTVRAEWAVLLRDLALAYRRPHVLRHSVGTALVAAGVPLGDVARYLGDSVQTVVTTYLHPSGTDPAEAMEKALGSGRKVGGSTWNAKKVLQFKGKSVVR
jgi:integrase